VLGCERAAGGQRVLGCERAAGGQRVLGPQGWQTFTVGKSSPWVVVRAPVRVLDAGGWTDTWFARYGTVCHLCVGPGAEVRARLLGRAPGRQTEVHLAVPDFGESYGFSTDHSPGRHPLLEAALARWAPHQSSLEVSVAAAVPPGSSLGTSAAVVVALICALALLGGRELGPGDLARAAHQVETEDLCRQCGVQDQVAAAFGGANVVEVGPYPGFSVERLRLPPQLAEALAQRTLTVYLAARHDSSAVHETVIAHLQGDEATCKELLDPMREAARRAARALLAGDLEAYAAAMADNTLAQAALHPSLVNPLARKVIELAEHAGALGWKVNGAGGPGGTVTVIGPEDPRPLEAALSQLEGVSLLRLSPAQQGVHLADQG
jgi:D-glycero-alpha-D-manno-heptose-7-phosphate kinase